MPTVPPGTPQQRKRVRVRSVETTITRDSRLTVRVELEWIAGELLTGEGLGTNTPQGRMMAGAAAAIEAIAPVAEGVVALEIRGTKLVRAFDNLIVITALRGQVPGRRFDLIGSTVAPQDDLSRGAVLAVLDATNRILEPHVPPPAPPASDSDP
jgi:hypothetical protein